MRQFNYDMKRGEFVENPTGEESGNITGNRVFVQGEGSSLRFQVEINALGNVIGALNRLIKSINPDFIFPQKNKITLTNEEKQLYVKANGNYCPYCNSENIEGTGGTNVDDYGVDIDVECLSCKRDWKDVYILSDIVEM
jgi:hypothetical protein